MLLVLACMLPLTGHARQSDRDQPIKVTADQFDSQAKPNGVTHLKGHVIVVQGTLKVTSATATIYFDGNSKMRRVVFTGSPAHIQQMDDNGNLIKGHADTLDYDIPNGIATLTGDAWIEQQGRGSARGNVLIYNTQTSTMSASSKGDERVHLIFQPSKDTGTSAPAKSDHTDKH